MFTILTILENIINFKGIAIEMKFDEFIEYPRGLSVSNTTRTPKLADVCMVHFQKGLRKIFWKKSFNEKEFDSSHFLLKKVEDKLHSGI